MVLSDFNEGENSYRRLAENLPGIVYRVLIEDDNRMIFFNDMVQTMTGYNPKDLKRGEVCSIDPIILPEDRLNVINIVKDAIENNVPFEVEYRINNKSGDVKWFSERGRPVKGDNGNPSYIDGVIYDITKRKEAEQKLKTSELNILKVSKYKIVIIGIVLGVLFWVIDAITDTLFFYSEGDLIQQLFYIEAHELWMRLIVILFIEALSVYSQINYNKVRTNEQKLKSEKEKAQKYLDIAGVMIVAINADQTIQLINQKGCEFLEEEESKIIGMNWFDNYIPENVREQVKITFNRILSGEIKPFKYYENAVITKNGKKRIISWHNQISKNKAGKIIGTLSSGLDITERKKAELKIKESEEKFRKQNVFLNNIIESLTHPFYVINVKDYRVVLANSTASSEGLELEQYCYRFTHNNDKPCEGPCKCPLDEVKNTKKACVVEHIHYDKEGNEKTYEIYGYPILDENGNVVQMIEYALNISDRKKAENNLRKIARQWRTTFDAMSECVLLLDLESNILQCNKITLDFLGKKDYDEIIGHLCLEIIRGPSTLEDRCPMIRMLESNKTETSIAQIGNKWCEISANPVFNDEGSLIGAVQIITDITERKKAEAALHESEEKFRNLIEQSVDGVLLVNEEGIIIEWNKGQEQITGLKKEDVLGRPLWDIQSQTDPGQNKSLEQYERIKEMIKDAFKTGDAQWLGKLRDINIQRVDNKEIRTIQLLSFLIKNENKIMLGNFSRDITEQKQIQKEIQEKQATLESIFRAAPIGIGMVQNRVFTQLNDRLCKLIGYTPDELLNNSARIVYPSDEEYEFVGKEKYTQIAKFGIGTVETKFLRKDGKIIDVLLSSVPLDLNNLSVGITFTALDITERKKAERELKESEEKYRDLFESSPISLWEEDYSELKKYIDKLKNSRINNLRSYFDENPEEVKKCVSMVKIVDINQETLELYKADKKEVFFSSLNKVFTEESYNTFKEQIIKFAEGKTRFETEAINCTLNGDKLFVFLVCEIVAGFKEDWSKVLVSIVDISERKKAEKKLIESEEKFRTIAERALMGIIIIQDNQIKYVNDALLNMFEYSQEELINWEKEDLIKLIHPEDLSFLREYREHIRSGDKGLKPFYSYRVLTKLGKVKWIDQFSKEIQYKGRSAELVTIMDITEKKEAEQELVKLNNLKSELLRRTSHELRTPLVSIKGFSDLLLELHRGKLDDYVIKTIEQIKGGCSRLESLVNDILKTAELESGTVKLKKSKEDLSLLIKICVSELEGLSELRNHSINLEIPDKLIYSFEKEQIYMVITNILINAINFTPYNGKIEVKLEINKDFIIISIMDNGIGFTEEEKTQIFMQFGKIERYGQGYDVISEGSGLGLYISKKIVELHGGKIWLESEGRNKGSTFIVSLPVDKK